MQRLEERAGPGGFDEPRDEPALRRHERERLTTVDRTVLHAAQQTAPVRTTRGRTDLVGDARAALERRTRLLQVFPTRDARDGKPVGLYFDGVANDETEQGAVAAQAACETECFGVGRAHARNSAEIGELLGF